MIVSTTQLSKEGIEFSKSALKVWLDENEQKIMDENNSAKMQFVIKTLKRYLKDE